MLCTGPITAAKAEQKSLVPVPQAQQTNQERPLSCVLFEPCTAVSTVGRVQPSLVYLYSPTHPERHGKTLKRICPAFLCANEM
jgi:hypothetical protein